MGKNNKKNVQNSKSEKINNIKGNKRKKRNYSASGRLKHYIKNDIEENIRLLIQSLDTLSLDFKEKPRPISLDFPNSLNNEEFKNLFLKGIKYAKKYFKINNLINLKLLLSKFKELDNINYNNNECFPFLISNNKIEKIFKIDLLLSLLADEDKTNFILTKEMDINLIFTNIKEYKMYDKKQIFEDAIDYNNEISGDISITNFESLLYSHTVLNCFKETIEELYNKKIDADEIKKQLIEFRSSHKIFFIEMPPGLFGLLLFDGTILINKSYYIQSQQLFHNSTSIFIIFFSLFHEYMHVLSRLFLGDKNYFNNTGNFINNGNIRESGKFFEKKFLLNVLKRKSITKIETDYLIDKSNYNFKTSKEFGDAFSNFRKSKEKEIKLSTRISISKNEDNQEVPITIGCSCAGVRKDTIFD